VCNGGFVKNVAKELNASNCQDDEFFGTWFSTNYDIAKVDGSKFYFGEWTEENDGTEAAKRPTAIGTRFFEKQP
jgi:hypothetical protein